MKEETLKQPACDWLVNTEITIIPVEIFFLMGERLFLF
jgi:hypothetical protein